MKINPTDPTFLVFSLLWAALWLVLGWFANHWFSSARDRKNRLADFLGFMGEWQVGALRWWDTALVRDFPDMVKRFGREMRKIKSDLWFWKRRKFVPVCDAIIGMTDSQVEGGREKLLGKINEIIALLD